MSYVHVGLEIVSVSLGFLGGYFVGKWDSRKSDLWMYNEMATGITAWALDEISKAEGGDFPEDHEITASRNEWFAKDIKRLQNEATRSWKLGLLVIGLSILVFAVAQLVD
jgi:hypothetical protein